MRIRYKILAIIAFIFVTGCEPGTGVGLDQNGNPVSTPAISLADNLRSIQTNIFTPNCAISGCHSGISPPEGLLLTDGNSFQNIVSQPSNRVPTADLIVPGNPDSSYLIMKIEGSASEGGRMPLDLPVLSNEKIQALKSWVQKGALLFDPTLTAIQENVFTPRCVKCHFGTNPAGGLNLEAGLAFANLVNVSRPFDPEIRVVSGDANSSFLIDKLEGNNLGGSRGDRMPLGGPFLQQDVIDVIRDWINTGALNN